MMETGTHKGVFIANELDCDGDLGIQMVDTVDWIDKGKALDIIAHLADKFDIKVIVTISETN